MQTVYIIIITITTTTLTSAFIYYKCWMKSIKTELEKELTIEQLSKLS